MPTLSHAPTSPPAQFWRAPARIDLARLIDRKAYDLDRESVAEVLRGRRILITGAGGSIGSELATVCAEFEPAEVILVERAENALFEIDRRLAARFPQLKRHAVLHDVIDEARTLRLVEKTRPNIVFHAAAHKHVPLMEDHPAHALTNNLFGTKSIADACAATGVGRFVMISTDKAVNPVSVMGATKRLAELYVRWLSRQELAAKTRMSMVRFGNVLGSACSVLTIWAAQVAEGSPITVTDPNMTRFFMTIPEAATLVIQSTTLPQSAPGAIYVLDMGKPISIVELAKRFIRQNGLEPRLVLPGTSPKDAPHSAPAELPANTIDILFTGARPGEKIHEELAYAVERLRPTNHPGISSWVPAPEESAAEEDDALVQLMAELREVRHQVDDQAAVIDAIRRGVPEMRRAA